MFFKRRLPAEHRPPLARDERMVAWAEVDDGGVVVATTAGLFLPGRGERLGWHEIHKAVWTGRQLVITPAEVVEAADGYLVTVDADPVTLRLPEPGDVPSEVRARVNRSVAFTSQEPVPGGGVRVVARRVPGVDGLTWAVRYDPGTDRAAPGVRDATAQLVATLAAQQPRVP